MTILLVVNKLSCSIYYPNLHLPIGLLKIDMKNTVGWGRVYKSLINLYVHGRPVV